MKYNLNINIENKNYYPAAEKESNILFKKDTQLIFKYFLQKLYRYIRSNQKLNY